MADNYLEKRMEELRSGRLNQTFRAGDTAYKRTGMNFPFPPKRVLISTEEAGYEQIASVLLKTGSKVATMTESRSQDTRIREYGIDNIKESFEDLLKSWRDIDILITDADMAKDLISVWIKHREKYPYVSDYICRIIIFGDGVETECPDVRKKLKCTINWVTKNNPEMKDISGLVGMLILPVNDFIDGMTFTL